MILKGKLGNYTLGKSIARGGEGEIFLVKNRQDIVIKRYLIPQSFNSINSQTEFLKEFKLLEEKLLFMRDNPPDNSVFNDLAWPIDVLYSNEGTFFGFVMPKLDANKELASLYSYNPDNSPLLTYQHKITVAINLCIVIAAVHKAGYVFGDFNPLNIGVNLNDGHVGFFDTDSYHIYNKSKDITYRCKVCLSGYVAPELLNHLRGLSYQAAPLPTFTQETDRFALAIHIFKLLMNGFTPYNGIKATDSLSTASPGLNDEAVKNDNYCFKPGNVPMSVATPDINKFPEAIKKMFDLAFIDGRVNPNKRPTADDWINVLSDYFDNLKQCPKNHSHYYYKNNSTCPYCEADTKYKAILKKANRKQRTFVAAVAIPPPKVKKPRLPKPPMTKTVPYKKGGNPPKNEPYTLYSTKKIKVKHFRMFHLNFDKAGYFVGKLLRILIILFIAAVILVPIIVIMAITIANS